MIGGAGDLSLFRVEGLDFSPHPAVCGLRADSDLNKFFGDLTLTGFRSCLAHFSNGDLNGRCGQVWGPDDEIGVRFTACRECFALHALTSRAQAKERTATNKIF